MRYSLRKQRLYKMHVAVAVNDRFLSELRSLIDTFTYFTKPYRYFYIFFLLLANNPCLLLLISEGG